jgi:hypothetical protein
MKRNFFLKMLMFMFGIAAFGVVEGDGETGGNTGGGAEGETGGQPDKTNPADVEIKDDKDKDKSGGISDNEAKLLRELMEKKASLKKVSDQLNQVNDQLKKFDGINLEEVQALLKDRKESEDKELEAKGAWDRLKANLVEQHGAELSARDQRIAELQAELQSKDGHIHGLTIGSAFSASKFISDELILTPNKAQIVYGGHFEYQDGKIVGFDKPKGEASRTQLIDNQGEPLSFDAALAKIVEMDQDKERLIRSKAKPGASSGGSDDSATRRTGVEITGRDRIASALSGKK